MEKSKKPPSAEELLRRILELEKANAHLKQQISRHWLEPAHRARDGPGAVFKPGSSVKRQSHGGASEPLAMKLTEAQYRNILQSMSQAMHIFDLNGRIIFWNRAAESLYGFTPEEAYGKTPTELLVEPRDSLLADVIVERTTVGEFWSGEFPIKNKRGERFVVICTNTPFHDENRRLLGGMCISSDSRPYQVMKPELSVSLPMRLPSTTDGHDSRQPQQPSIASKISSLASKMKLKLKTGEKYRDEEGRSEDSPERETYTPKGHIAPSPFGVFSSIDTAEHLAGEMTLEIHKAEAWKDQEVEALDARVDHFGWHLSQFNQEHKSGRSHAYANLDLPNTNSVSSKIEASGLWFSSLHGNTSSSSSSDASIIVKVEREMDGQDYEILWEDLMVKEQIGQGNRKLICRNGPSGICLVALLVPGLHLLLIRS